jgi:hypothetical protein
MFEESVVDVHLIFRNTATNQASTHSAELTWSQISKALLDQIHVSAAANQKVKNNKWNSFESRFDIMKFY